MPVAFYYLVSTLCAVLVPVAESHGDWKLYLRVAKSVGSLERMQRVAFELEGHQFHDVDDAGFLEHFAEVVEGCCPELFRV